MAWTKAGREHEERMQVTEFEHKEREAAAIRAAQAEADRLHYENEVKNAKQRHEKKLKNGQVRNVLK